MGSHYVIICHVVLVYCLLDLKAHKISYFQMRLKIVLQEPASQAARYTFDSLTKRKRKTSRLCGCFLPLFAHIWQFLWFVLTENWSQICSVTLYDIFTMYLANCFISIFCKILNMTSSAIRIRTEIQRSIFLRGTTSQEKKMLQKHVFHWKKGT